MDSYILSNHLLMKKAKNRYTFVANTPSGAKNQFFNWSCSGLESAKKRIESWERKGFEMVNAYYHDAKTNTKQQLR